MDYIAVYEDVEQLASIEPEEFNRKRLRLRLLKCCLFSLVVEKSTTSSEEGFLIKTNEINNGSKNVQSFLGFLDACWRSYGLKFIYFYFQEIDL